MATAATTMEAQNIERVSPTRRYVMGAIFVGIALLIWGLFLRNVAPDAESTFILASRSAESEAWEWAIPSTLTLELLAGLAALIGAFQLGRGFGKRTNLMLGVVVLVFIFGLLSWLAASGSVNLAGVLRSSLQRALPIVLGALSGILCERAGVVNIAIEGMMLTGAMVGALVGSISNIWIGLLAAVLSGALLALVHGVLSIKYRTDQIVSGTVINIFATGITSFISAKFMQRYQDLNSPGLFPSWEIPGLSKIPFIGPIFFDANLFMYGMFIFIIVIHFALYYTRWGLRVRAVGEHPKAADTLGINVFRTRYMSVILGGMMAGFAGAYLTLGSVGRFDEVMTAGRGFIGLAAMIFGNWNPVGALGAGLLFGFSDYLRTLLGIFGVQIRSEFLLMAPYIATMVVLAGVVGRGHAPAADGTPYVKE